MQPSGCSPTSRHDGLDARRHRGLSASPPFRVPAKKARRGSETLSDRTLRLFSWNTEPEGLLQRASVEHGQARLRASGSTGTAHDGWLGHPLSPAGEAEFTGHAAQSRGRTRHVSTTDDRRTVFCMDENTPSDNPKHAFFAASSGLEDNVDCSNAGSSD